MAFVSGLVLWPLRQRPVLSQFARRVQQLLVPFVMWVPVLWLVFFRDISPNLFTTLRNALWTPDKPAGLWYLYALFVCDLLFILMTALPWRTLWLALGSLACVGLSMIPLKANILGAESVTWIFPFFAAGFLLAPLTEWVAAHRFRLVFAAMTLYVPLVMLGQHHWHKDTFKGLLAWTLLRYATAAVLTLGLWSLFARVSIAPARLLARVGVMSLGIYATHQVILIRFAEADFKIWPLTAVIALVASMAITWGIGKIPVVRTLLLGTRAPSHPPAETPALIGEGATQPAES
jgi:fucose 4-O-acetylase-like acetyltransferase